jgi:hypothetical protein
MTDYAPGGGHGTKVASAAVGINLGVASRANLVCLKWKNASKNPQNTASQNWVIPGLQASAIFDAMIWLLQDVRTQRASAGQGNAKFIINISAGLRVPSRSVSQDVRDSVEESRRHLRGLIERCWESNIVTVAAAGNGGLAGDFLDLNSPQDMGKDNNTLITVGAVNLDGTLWPGSTPDRGRGGSITVYAQGESVRVASADGGTSLDSGTSFAAPQVVGKISSVLDPA